jgi:hypothetical protein
VSASPYDDFLSLYDDVTVALRSFVRAGLKHGSMTKDEQLWFEQLIGGFDGKFKDWPNAKRGTAIGEYLRLFDARRVSKPLRVAGHAFLHVAYDLPRVIADSLNSRPATDRPRLRSLFLMPGPVFRERFMAQARAGTFGVLLRPVGHLRPAEILAYWLLSLRSVAWIHAETLADSGGLRPTLESQLADGLLEAGKAGTTGSIAELDNHTLFRSMSVLTPVAEHPVIAGVIGAGVIAVILASATRARNQAIANRIAYLGGRIYIEATKALHGGENAPPPERPVLALA